MTRVTLPEDSDAFAIVERLEALAASDPSLYVAHLAWRYSWLADEYLEQGNYDEYLACFMRAAALMRKRVAAPSSTLVDRWDLGQHLFNVASVALRLGDLPTAGAALDEADGLVASLESEVCPMEMGRELFRQELAKLRGRLVGASPTDGR